ncbi:MAG: sulfatase-like hydrolase/transferase [Planctomycetota bacterium]
MLSRRNFLRSVATGAIAMALPQALFSKNKAIDKPNIILCMADDMGWGDPGFNGNKIIKTRNLDVMAKAGLRFSRFYSAVPGDVE